MGIARRGYEAVGLSWDERNQEVAAKRAAILGLNNVTFPIGDARHLDEHENFAARFDAVICFENIEHVIDDRKLFRDMFRCLKPGGRLYLTSPNYNYRPLSAEDMGPFSLVEDGSHVRRGYTPCMLRELCQEVGFEIEEITFVSHFFSQVLTRLGRAFSGVLRGRLAWLVTLPLRPLPLLLDGWLGRWVGSAVGWPGYSIALVAYKRRFG
jgi:2-polyprenyl-3-methyl-5-hydroxy-6-metoxy-1,4-benzoquinol methylase